MKTKNRIKQLWKTFLSIFLISFHLSFGLCRPYIKNVDTKNSIQNVDYPDSKGRHSQVRPVYDLKRVRSPEIYTMRENRRLEDNENVLYSDKNFNNVVSSDVVFINDIDDVFDDDTLFYNDDVASGEEDSVRRHGVVPFTDRNLVRKRRQPEAHKAHRRRRRKHRLVLKARDRNLLSNGEEDLKDRRNTFLIKSDSPGYFIASASEVKKGWCRTIHLRQKISEPNCRSKEIENNFCYGQCNSFFIPHPGRTDNKIAFQSCAFCKPYKQRWGNITLNCPGHYPPKIEKTVLFVDSCKCMNEVLQ